MHSPSSSALVMSLFTFGSPIVDIHMVKTRPRIRVRRSLESDAPRSSLHATHRFWPEDPPSYSFLDADLCWESEEKKAVAGSSAWDVAWVGTDEQQLHNSEEEESDGSVRPLEDDSDAELVDGTEFLDLAMFPVPDEPSSEEEDSGEEGGEEGSEEGGEERNEDSQEQVPLAERKVSRV